jgi:glycosyltransferase involved in cell wall biosynthesis
MKKILYIGNNLKTKTSNVASIQLLGGLLESEGYAVYFASAKRNKLLRLCDMVFSLLRYQNRVKYVLIDVYSTQNFYFALIISQLCRLFGKPYITNLNGGNLPLRLERNPYLSSLIFKHAHMNVSPSYYLQQAFEAHGYTDVKYIPNSIAMKDYAFQSKTYKTIKLLWVRSFSKIYNPSLAIQVLRHLLDQGYAAELCMVGPDADGSLKAVKKLAKQLKVKVRFTGKLSKPEWTTLAKDYNVFLNTTNFDNAPVSVIEAMALGLPVVSTNVGGMPFLIDNGKNGVLVAPENAEALCTAIIRLHEQPKFANTVALNARAMVEAFDWETVKLEWFEVLGSVIEKKEEKREG